MPERPRESSAVPLRAELEAKFGHRVVTYEDAGTEKPGGMCGCCGSGPDVAPSWRGNPWYVYRAGICDADGVFYAYLCEGCLEELREENRQRPEAERDVVARVITKLLGGDLDGAQAMMDDLGP